MDKKMLDRINELAKKKKAEGLTDAGEPVSMRYTVTQ